MTSRSLLISATLAIFLSCKSDLYNRVAGYWSIDTIEFYDEPVYKSLIINTFSLDRSGGCTVPPIYWDKPHSDVTVGNWKLIGSDSLLIETFNPIFKGRYRFSFVKDFDNKLLYIHLENQKTRILARKGLWNFDSDENWGDW